MWVWDYELTCNKNSIKVNGKTFSDVNFLIPSSEIKQREKLETKYKQKSGGRYLLLPVAWDHIVIMPWLGRYEKRKMNPRTLLREANIYCWLGKFFKNANIPIFLIHWNSNSSKVKKKTFFCVFNGSVIHTLSIWITKIYSIFNSLICFSLNLWNVENFYDSPFMIKQTLVVWCDFPFKSANISQLQYTLQ